MTLRKVIFEEIPEDAARSVIFEEIPVNAERLSDVAYSKLVDLVEDELGHSEPEICYIEEAEFLLAIQKAIIKKAPYIILKVSYPKEENK